MHYVIERAARFWGTGDGCRSETGSETVPGQILASINFRSLGRITFYRKRNNSPQIMKIELLISADSHQEHCHTPTDARNYTECELNREIVDMTFRFFTCREIFTNLMALVTGYTPNIDML